MTQFLPLSQVALLEQTMLPSGRRTGAWSSDEPREKCTAEAHLGARVIRFRGQGKTMCVPFERVRYFVLDPNGAPSPEAAAQEQPSADPGRKKRPKRG